MINYYRIYIDSDVYDGDRCLETSEVAAICDTCFNSKSSAELGGDTVELWEPIEDHGAYECYSCGNKVGGWKPI